MKDKFQRNINYLRVSVTDLCNFRCLYCMPEKGIERKDKEEILTLEELYYVIHLLVQKGVTKIRITGGEPLLRPNIVGLIQSISKLTSVTDIAMTTNGVLLKKLAKALKDAGLKRVNVSLDTLDSNKFKTITRGGDLEKVLEGIQAALDVGLAVKINSVLLKDINDSEIPEFIDLTKKYPIDVRFIEAMPIGSTASFSKKHFMSCEEVLKVADLVEIEDSDVHSPARMYCLPQALGRVGLIRPLSNHFCANCNRMRLTADGNLKPCLLSDRVIALRKSIRLGQDINPLIDQALAIKPKQHHLAKGEIIKTGMSRIGG